MLRKVKNQNITNLAFDNSELAMNNKEAQEITEKKDNKDLESVIQQQKSKKLDSHDTGYNNSKSITSARSGIISDNGGRAPEFKSDLVDSLWKDKAIKAESAEEPKARVEYKIDKEAILNYCKDNPKKDIQIASGTNAVVFSEEKNYTDTYKFSKGKVSLFDKDPFSRLVDKTEGEKLSDKRSEESIRKDESWKKKEKYFSSKQVVSRMFDNLINKNEG